MNYVVLFISLSLPRTIWVQFLAPEFDLLEADTPIFVFHADSLNLSRLSPLAWRPNLNFSIVNALMEVYPATKANVSSYSTASFWDNPFATP
ncbi:hypothetical protein CsSME_00008676 [Camellia sinensis var. sinensis]